jgi:hypothetical protein
LIEGMPGESDKEGGKVSKKSLHLLNFKAISLKIIGCLRKKVMTMPAENQSQYSCFIAIPFLNEFDPVRKAVIKGVEEADFRAISLHHSISFLPSGIQGAIISELGRAECIAAVMTDGNPNVFFELGLAMAMGKGLLQIVHREAKNL